jgi:hypothetical protein
MIKIGIGGRGSYGRVLFYSTLTSTVVTELKRAVLSLKALGQH